MYVGDIPVSTPTYYKFIVVMHRAGIVHTDIKPDNVVLVDDRTSTVRYIDPRGILRNKVLTPAMSLKKFPLTYLVLDCVRTRRHKDGRF